LQSVPAVAPKGEGGWQQLSLDANRFDSNINSGRLIAMSMLATFTCQHHPDEAVPG